MDAALALKQRTWRQKAQHHIRVLLTSFRAFKSKYELSSEENEKVLSEISNAILMEKTVLPTLQLPESLPLLTALESSKRHLAVKTQRNLDKLEADLVLLRTELDQTLSLFQDAEKHVSLDVPWQRNMQVFAAMTYPKILELVSEGIDMLSKDLNLKVSVRTAFASFAGETWPSAEEEEADDRSKKREREKSVTSDSKSKMTSKEDLEPILTTHLTCWMLNPYVNEAVIESNLAALHLEMTSA